MTPTSLQSTRAYRRRINTYISTVCNQSSPSRRRRFEVLSSTIRSQFNLLSRRQRVFLKIILVTTLHFTTATNFNKHPISTNNDNKVLPTGHGLNLLPEHAPDVLAIMVGIHFVRLGIRQKSVIFVSNADTLRLLAFQPRNIHDGVASQLPTMGGLHVKVIFVEIQILYIKISIMEIICPSK